MNSGWGSLRRALGAITVLAVAACGGNAQSTSSGFDAGGDVANHLRDSGRIGVDGPMRLGSDARVDQGTLTISPANPTLTVTNSASPPSQAFTTTLTRGGTAKAVTSNWTLSDFTVGAVNAGGTFTAQGTIAGTATVIATYGAVTATTKVTVVVKLTTQLTSVTLPDGTVIPEDSSAVTPADMTALQGAPKAGDAGAPPTIIYPYDQTVFPLGLLAPVTQFAGGAVTPVDFKISLDTTGFHWDGFGHIGNPAQLQAAIPQPIWDGALLSAQPNPKNAVVVLSIVTAASGVAYGPAQAHLVIAPGKLTGVIYFESYSGDALPVVDGGTPGETDFGLWAVKPGATQPPSHLQQGCVICHGVSASGNTLTNGTDDPTVGPNTGVFRVEADGGYTHLATAPPNLPYPITSIDSRGLGWGTVSPDGRVILRGLDQFWGGQSLLAWATPPSPLMGDGGLQPLTTTMTVNGDFNMFVPEFSEDGKHLVFVNAPNTTDAGAMGAPSQSIGVLDIATSVTDGGGGSFGTVTLSKQRTVYDSTTADAGAAGSQAFTKVPTFLPDSQSIVFQETISGSGGFDHMLPDWNGGIGSYVDGALAMLEPTGHGGYVRVTLTNANTASYAGASTQNYEPKPLPVQVGGYYWVVFASLRTDAYPTLGTTKKLWVTAISPGAAPGTDASHPPFTLINQAIVPPQETQRAYWALAPCQGANASCQTSNDCCNGSCLPSSGTDPTSPLVCRTPTMMCAPLGGRCQAGQDQDCCNASQGVQCIGTLNGFGTCAAPGPPP